MDDYEPVRQAARRWLERSETPEYKRRKQEQLLIRRQIGVMRRFARQHRDDDAIGLLNFLEAELLSQIKRVESTVR
ncbi:MAG TPA: hypothetical protein V6D48_19325 [Oculatellaceae cyanobacterium]